MKKVFSLLSVFLLLSLTVLSFASCGNSGVASDYDSGSSYKSVDNSEILTSGEVSVTDQKLIKTCNINAETKEFDQAVASIETSLKNAGGYVESENLNSKSYGSGYTVRNLSMTVKIPAEQLDDFNSEMKGLLNITSYSAEVENVTEEYYDYDATLTSLKAQRDSLLVQLENLTDFSYWSNIQEKITDLETKIAVLEGKLKNIDKLVAYSTVNIDLTEVQELTETAEPTFWERIKSAFSESWVAFGEGWQDFAVFFVSAFPTLLVLALIGGGLFCAIFFPLRASEKKRLQKLKEMNEQAYGQNGQNGQNNQPNYNP